MKPYRCPVCEGRGNVPAGFFTRMVDSTSTVPDPCWPCGGTGIIWGAVNGKARLLDLYCGAGGTALGYYQAGFDVVGLEDKP